LYTHTHVHTYTHTHTHTHAGRSSGRRQVESNTSPSALVASDQAAVSVEVDAKCACLGKAISHPEEPNPDSVKQKEIVLFVLPVKHKEIVLFVLPSRD